MWLLAMTILIVAMAFVVHRGQDQNWDLLSYHYYSGYAFIHNRFLEDVAPITWHTYLNPLPNVITFLAYSRLPFPISAFALLTFQCLSLVALVLLAREIGKDLGHSSPTLAELIAVVLTAAAPLWWSELGTSFYSSTTTPLVLVALLLLIKGVTSASSFRIALACTAAAGVLIGLASALKMTNAFFALAGLAALGPVLITERLPSATKRALAYLSGVAVGLALLGWWNVKLFREFGSPIYPLYNAIFRSNYYDLVNWHDPRFGFGVVDFFRFPVVAAVGTTATSEVPFADARYLLCVGSAVLVLVRRALIIRHAAYRNVVSTMVLSFVACGICVWALIFPYQRYLIPIELLLGLVTWILLAYTGLSKRLVTALLVAFVVVSVVLLRIPDWGHAAPRQNAANIFGLQLPHELISEPAEYLVAGAPDGFVLAFLNPESHFYRIDFSTKVYERIRQRLAEHRTKPVRVLTMAAAPMPVEELRKLGFQVTTQCATFRSNVGAYVSCKLSPIE